VFKKTTQTGLSELHCTQVDNVLSLSSGRTYYEAGERKLRHKSASEKKLCAYLLLWHFHCWLHEQNVVTAPAVTHSITRLSHKPT